MTPVESLQTVLSVYDCMQLISHKFSVQTSFVNKNYFTDSQKSSYPHSTLCITVVLNGDSVAAVKSRLKIFLFSQVFSSSSANTLPGPSASEVTTLWRYTNLLIRTIIITVQDSLFSDCKNKFGKRKSCGNCSNTFPVCNVHISAVVRHSTANTHWQSTVDTAMLKQTMPWRDGETVTAENLKCLLSKLESSHLHI